MAVTIKVVSATRRVGVIAEIFNICVGVLALATVLERGLWHTGFIVFCAVGGTLAGDYARVQKTRKRTSFFFGLVQSERNKPVETVEPGWAIISLVAGLMAFFFLA